MCAVLEYRNIHFFFKGISFCLIITFNISSVLRISLTVAFLWKGEKEVFVYKYLSSNSCFVEVYH